jgi:hypothetical protein
MRTADAHNIRMQYLWYILYSELKRAVLLFNSLTKDNNMCTWLRVSNTSLFSVFYFNFPTTNLIDPT